MSYSSWYAIATGQSGASGLAGIVDASYAGDPAGTDCDSSYWESRAYDQIRQLYVSIGSNPGSGVDGNFTLNQNNSSNDGEDSILSFSRGSAIGGSADLRWDSSETHFLFNQDVTSTSNIGTSGTPIPKVWATDIDAANDVLINNDLDVTGVATVTTLTVTGTTTLNTLSLGGNLGIDGTIFTLNVDYAGGTPTENAAIVVERGTETDAVLRWNETDEQWEAWNLTDSAYNTLAMFDSSGFTDESIFEDSGGVWGTERYAARSDHTHSGGSLNATGSDETTWRIDEDYVSGSANIELQFGASANKIRYNPGGNDRFEFSKTISSDTNNTDDLGTSSVRWRDLYLSGDIDVSGDYIGSLQQTGGAFTYKTNASARSIDADMEVDRGTNTNTRIRWNEGSQKWTYTNDGSNYYYLVGADDSSDVFTTPGDLSVTGSVTGDLTLTGNTIYLGQTSNDFTFSVPRIAGANARIVYDDSVSLWKIDHGSGAMATIATLTGTETLSGKTLTSPSISSPSITSSGSWAGNPTFSGDPTFSANPSFSGAPNFTADSNSRPIFQTTVGYAPFTISDVGSGVSATVSGLSSDRLDGYHSSSFLLLNGSQSMSGNLDMGGNTITNYTGLSHKGSHQAGGDDQFDGVLGNATGSNAQVWTVNADGASATGTRLSLGGGNYYVEISDPFAGLMGLGGSGVDAVPGSVNQNQDIGNPSRRWRAGYIDHHLNMNLQTSAPSGISNGSLWVKSGTPQVLYTYLNGASHKIIDSSGGSDITGLTGPVTVTGDLIVTGALTATVGSHDHATSDITSGELEIVRGGTNNNGSYVGGEFLYYHTGNNKIQSSGMSSSDFAASASAGGHTHAADTDLTGTLPINRGGTGNTTFEDEELLRFNAGSGYFESSGIVAGDIAVDGHTHVIGDLSSGLLPTSLGGTGNADNFDNNELLFYLSGAFYSSGITVNNAARKTGFEYTGSIYTNNGSPINILGGANGDDAISIEAGTRLVLNGNSTGDTHLSSSASSGTQVSLTVSNATPMTWTSTLIQSRTNHNFLYDVDITGSLDVGNVLTASGSSIFDGTALFNSTSQFENLVTMNTDVKMISGKKFAYDSGQAIYTHWDGGTLETVSTGLMRFKANSSNKIEMTGVGTSTLYGAWEVDSGEFSVDNNRNVSLSGAGGSTYITNDTSSDFGMQFWLNGYKQLRINSSYATFLNGIWMYDNKKIHLGDQVLNAANIYFDEPNNRLVINVGTYNWYLNTNGTTSGQSF